MSDSTLSQRLKAARSRAFVGRAAELDLFAQAATAEEPPFSLLWFYGPGGVGKSTLVRRLADEASSAGAHVVLLDARTCEPSPSGVRQAVGDLPVADRVVVLLDTAEVLAPVEDWLREEYLPSLPARSTVVIASRHAPGPRWRSDLGWAQEMRAVALANLEPAAATAFLAARGVPAARQPSVLELTHGHPLALALVADVLAQRPSQAIAPPALTYADLGEVLPALVERFIDDVPDPLRRKALQVFGHARVTTEGLLRAVLGDEHAADCYGWLRTLSFTQVWSSGRLAGLVPHDLAREVLDNDLRLRDEEAWTRLHQQIRRYYAERSLATTGAEQVRAVSDLLWFHRASPALRAYYSWDAVFSLWAQEARESDLPQILDLVRAHEGPESVRLHEAWWARQPAAFGVIRARPGEVHGFVVQLWLDGTDGLGVARDVDDPFAIAAMEHVQRGVALRRSQHLRIVRSWMGRDGYYTPTPTHQMVTGLLTRTWLTEPGLAVSLAFSADPLVWTPMFAHVDYARAPDADVEAGGRLFAAYVHDWRLTPPAQWLQLMEDRELPGSAGATDATELAQRHVHPRGPHALTEEGFAQALRDAFRAFGRASELAANPLLGSQVLRQAVEPERTPTGDDLRALLRREVEGLAADGRRSGLARVLTVTYLTPAATQEAAAARLSLPFSTYRRHLANALSDVTRTLWSREQDAL